MLAGNGTRSRFDGWSVVQYAVLAAVGGLFCYLVFGFWQSGNRIKHEQSGKMLSALELYVLQYSEDNGGRLPPMGGLPQFRQAVMPYAKAESFFRAGDDYSLILPNPNLSGQKVSGVRKLTVLLYESKPSRADGSRWVALLPEKATPAYSSDPDFQGLELVKEADWRRLKAANGIP